MHYYKETRRHANVFLYLELASAASSLTFKPENNNKNNKRKKEKKNLIQIITAAPPVFRILRISNHSFYGVGVRGEHNLPQTAG